MKKAMHLLTLTLGLQRTILTRFESVGGVSHPRVDSPDVERLQIELTVQPYRRMGSSIFGERYLQSVENVTEKEW
jgi:hypothetical protein